MSLYNPILVGTLCNTINTLISDVTVKLITRLSNNKIKLTAQDGIRSLSNKGELIASLMYCSCTAKNLQVSFKC